MITKNLKTISLFVLVLCPLISLSQQDDAVLKIGQKITLHSKVLKETREVWVYLPPNYTDKYFQAQQHPVLYVLDGDAHFLSLSGLVQILGSGVNGTFVIPEMIVVAIPNTDRTRDLTPTHSTKGFDGKDWAYLQSSGGADNFLKFITTELAPKIDSSYRTFPYRILAGHSFGGAAVIHALYTIPNAFNAYVAIDPSLWWDDQILLKRGKEYLPQADLKGKSLFLAQANSITSWDSINFHFEAIKEFATILETRNRSNLKWSYKYYPADGHSSVAFISGYDALRFFFEKYNASFETITNAKELKECYRRFSEETNVKFIPPERVVQQFGSVALFLKKFDLALEFFQMNIENYPQSSSAYANMGQWWLSKGDKKKALEYYERSLKIYPKNEDSRNNVANLKKELQVKK